MSARPLSAANGSGPRKDGGASSSETSIKVVVRIRPSSTSDFANIPTRFQRTAVSAVNTATLRMEPTASSSSTVNYTFDRVIAPETTQEEVYDCTAELVDAFLLGFNATILAYGQSGSGKSYTMGTDCSTSTSRRDGGASLGITPRAIVAIFQHIAAAPKTTTYAVKLIYVELYHETLIDLLAGDLENKPVVQIREDKGGNIIWTGLSEISVSSAEEVMDHLRIGSSLRQTNATDVNAQSSRSHAIFSLTLTQRRYTGAGSPPATPTPPSPKASRRFSSLPRSTTPDSRMTNRSSLKPTSSSRVGTPSHGDVRDDSFSVMTSKFHFVDLAGSERLKRTAAAGERIKEGISINSGLLALGNVISALGDLSRNASHVPYRDSKLTRLLQDSLGGNSRTIMIACISPLEFDLDETSSTIKYANRAKRIKNSATARETEVGWDDVAYLQRTITRLRAELSLIKSGAHTSNSDDTSPDGQSNRSALALPQISRDEFALAIEPIVEEYEKALSALESQLALTKAALGHSEEEMRELEQRVEREETENDASGVMVGELKSRVAKLAERESTTEAYMRGLELRLEEHVAQGESSGATVIDLRREISNYREQAEVLSKLVSDLESKLVLSDRANAASNKTIELLENDVARRDEIFKQLESRLALLDAEKDRHQALLVDLDARDRRLIDLERNVDELRLKSTEAEREVERLELLAVSEMVEKEAEKAELQSQIRHLASSHLRSPVITSTPSSSSSRSSTASESDTLVSEIALLQSRYDQTLSELSLVTKKYEESRHELSDLRSDIDKINLERSQEDGDAASQMTPRNGRSTGDATPAGSRSPTARRSIQLASSAGPSFFRTGAVGNQRSRGRSGSLSLSEPWQGSPSQSSTLPYTTSFSSNSRDSRSRSPTIERSTFDQLPSSSSSSSITGDAAHEITRLRVMLREREEEIAELDGRLQQLRGVSAALAFGIDESDSNANLPPALPSKIEGPTTPPSLLRRRINSLDESSFSPQTLAAFRALRSELTSNSSPSKQISESVRLEDLMRSMARKDSMHRDTVNNMSGELTSLQRQHGELSLLSRNQVANMSAEIERLQSQLEARPRSVIEAKGLLSEPSVVVDSLRQDHRMELDKVRSEFVSERDLTSASHAKAIRIHLEDLKTLEVERDELMELNQRLTTRSSLTGAHRDDLEEELSALNSRHDLLIAQSQHDIAGLEVSLAELVEIRSTSLEESQQSRDALHRLEHALRESHLERDGLLAKLSIRQAADQAISDVAADVDEMGAEVSVDLKRYRASISELDIELSLASSPILDDQVSIKSISLLTRPNSPVLHNTPFGKPVPPPTVPPPALPRTFSSVSLRRSAGSLRSPTSSIDIPSTILESKHGQDAELSRLSSRLTHCEADLQSNVDLVNTLESALSDSERTLRKARMQMNDMAREKDDLSQENELLRSKIKVNIQFLSQMEMRKQEASHLARIEKDRVREESERRLEETQRKKSKFGCF